MADFHGTQEVVTDLREDGVLIMRINRPEKRNAINAVTSAAMEDIMNKAEKDKRVRVIVVTGTGEKAFCAGEDLSELSSGGECMTVTDHGFGGITDRLCPKPTICAVNGVAAGGGMEIAVSCDIVVAAEHARFGLTEPKVGLIASTGGLVRMARDVPRKAAMDMLLTARLVIGFVNYVVPAEELMDKALEIASTIAKNAPLSLKFTKQIVHAASQMSEEDAMRYCDAAYRFIEKTEDGIEGPAAFVEKRTPNWQGK